MLTVDNTIYTYGGLSVDANGYPNTNAIQNTLSLIDTNSFQWSPGSNGLGLTDHSTCYLKKCNCLVTFGGTRTGNPNEVTNVNSFCRCYYFYTHCKNKSLYYCIIIGCQFI